MQGRLRNERLTVAVRTECAHCKEPMELTIDSDLDHSVKGGGELMVFMPDVDLLGLEDESIINAF